MGLTDRLQQAAAARQGAVRRQAAKTAASARGPAGSASARGSAAGASRQWRRSGRFPAPPLDTREQRLGFAAAALAAVATLAFWLPHLGQRAAKGHASVAEDLALGLAMAGLLAWGAVLKRRWVLALVALYVGFIGPGFLVPSNNKIASVVGLPFVALGGWLVVKGTKAKAAARQAGGGASGTGTPAAGGAAPAGGSARAGRGRGRDRSQPKVDGTGRPIPVASKRYTPPKPAPKDDPKASRRAAARRPATAPETTR